MNRDIHYERRIGKIKMWFRAGTLISIILLAGSMWFLYGRVVLLENPYNPHYRTDNCADCHQMDENHLKASDCFVCHSFLTRELLPGAVARKLEFSNQTCEHPLKVHNPRDNRTVTQLCTGCHEKVAGYVAMTNISNNTYVEIDISQTHPVGLMPTELVSPKTLPLSKQTRAINCVTCHDPHGIDRRMRLLRYYYPGNGHPPDFRPLCNDCHADGWLPLRMRRTDVVREAKDRD